MPYISDVVDCGAIEKHRFNIVAAGCGTGKTYWVIHNLLKQFPDVKPCEILFVTSRTLVKQQVSLEDGTTMVHEGNAEKIEEALSKERDDVQALADYGILVCTYYRLAKFLTDWCGECAYHDVEPCDYPPLWNTKIVIFDECHSIFADVFDDVCNVLKLWIAEAIRSRDTLFIGLTATPGIIQQYSRSKMFLPKYLLDKPIFNHRAKQLVATDLKSIPYMIKHGACVGRTIMMCSKIEKCFELKQKIANSMVFVSPNNNQYYTEEMERVRQYIVDNESLPDTFIDDDGVEKPLDVLISTATLREGFNLRECSGVRTVICCIPDELHVIQFAGRCRYSIDKLIVAGDFSKGGHPRLFGHLNRSRFEYKNFYRGTGGESWFESISNIVDNDIEDTIRVTDHGDFEGFQEWFKWRWVENGCCNEDPRLDMFIYKPEDKQEILEKAKEYKVQFNPGSIATYNTVINTLRKAGWQIDNIQKRTPDGVFRGQLVVSN